MTETLASVAALAETVRAVPRRTRRLLVALAGPPGSGKSTLAIRLAETLTAGGCAAAVVPMDGFHLDNRVLTDLDLLDRKGAPETFDAAGFARLVTALGTEETVYYPLFDRSRDIAIAGAARLATACDTVIVEGNYLLLDAPLWRDLHALWDLRVGLQVPREVLRQRLIDRWLDEGLTQDAAIARADGNDLRNAGLVSDHMLACDVFFAAGGSQS